VHTLLVLDMAAAGHGDRVAVQHGSSRLTFSELLEAAWAVDVAGARHLAYVGTNSLAFPVALFGAAAQSVPFVPLNYRLSDQQLHDLLVQQDDVLVVADPEVGTRLAARGHRVVGRDDFLAGALKRAADAVADGPVFHDVPDDADGIALLLYTSGTTSAPKAAVLRHRHLTSYVIGSVEFGGADETDVALVSVPPYHIAGVANLLSNTFLGRRIIYLDRFDARLWLDTVRRESVTHAMVVPTMLARLCDAAASLAAEGAAGSAATAPAARTTTAAAAGDGAVGRGGGVAPSLRALSYGGSRTPLAVIERVMALFPGADLTNAYGLTETSSTIAVLGPDDHRAAMASDDPEVRGRLTSAGRLLPTIEIEVRDADGVPVAPGEVGDLFVRGDQVSGEYAGRASAVDAAGWFATRDRGHIDGDGFLFIEGRSDDTIIRGGENIAPAEIEEALLGHPGVASCAVVGVPDDEWGQRIAAVVVRAGGPDGATLDADTVTAFARDHLRGSKTPDLVRFVDDLPYTETGKLLRRQVLADLLVDWT
jgi:acyl-CoA synthetase (AMP-forming)/AMP-acid ligase II